jgi:imidazolonepropionase-like amidohydrolase
MRTLIRDVRVFEGVDFVSRKHVLIDGDRIAGDEGESADIEIDGVGRTLLPGLIDAHTHNVDADLAQGLTFGVTTELDMFCPPSNLARQRRLAAERDDVADTRSSIGSRLSPEQKAVVDREASNIPVDPNAVPNAIHAARMLHEAGAPLLAGTDPNIYAPLRGASLHRKLLMLTQAG